MTFYDIFFFNDTATTEIYTLSLHDALPISRHKIPRKDLDGLSWVTVLLMGLWPRGWDSMADFYQKKVGSRDAGPTIDRKSTRLNSSHANISYAVFCLKKKKKNRQN